MSLEKNLNSVELKELYANVLEAGADYDALSITFAELETTVKLKLKNRIRALRANSEYEEQASDTEKAEIEAWYIAATE
jgi:hypothetical protein